MLMKVFLLFSLVFSVYCEVLQLRIGVVYDKSVTEYVDVVYESVLQFKNDVTSSYDVTIEALNFDLSEGSNVYDDLISANLTSVIVLAKKLRCNRISTFKKVVPIYFVAGSEVSCDENELYNRILYLYPPNSAIISAVLAATKEYRWNEAIVLEESNQEFSFSFADMQLARERGLETMAFEAVADQKKLREALNVAKKEGVRAYILATQFSNTEMIMKIAEELELTTKNFHWFIPNLFINPRDLGNLMQGGLKLSLLYSPILTPLVEKIMNQYGNNFTAARFMSDVTASLTYLAMNSTWKACDSAVRNGCLKKNGQTYICAVNPEEVKIKEAYSQEITTPATTTIGTTTHGHAHGTTTTMGHAHGTPATTTTTMAHAHGSTTTTMGHAHGTPATTTTTIAHAHGSTTTTMGHAHSTSTTSTTTMAHGHGSTTTTMGHAHGTSTTSTTTMAHGHGSTTTTMGHGHGTATTSTTTMAHGHGSTTTTMGHAHATSTTTTMAHGHGSTTTTMGHGHGTSTTSTTTMAHAHGKRKRSITDEESSQTNNHLISNQQRNHYINSACHHKSCSSPRMKTKVAVVEDYRSSSEFRNLAVSKRSVTNETEENGMIPMRINSECLEYSIDDGLVKSAVQTTNQTFVAAKIGNGALVISLARYLGRKEDGPLAASIDTCRQKTSFDWNYNEETCSLKLVQDSEVSASNVIYIIEYSQSDSRLSPLVIGAYNVINEHSVNITYSPLLAHDIVLPDRELIIGALYHSPWLTWDRTARSENQHYQGFLFDFLESLSQSMNFSYKIVTDFNITDDIYDTEKIESDMLNIFEENKVDFFLHAKSVRGKRLGNSSTVALSAAFQQPSMYLLTKRVERTESVSIWQFMLPFREESWVLFWMTFPLISLLMAYMNKSNPNEYPAIAHTFGPETTPSDHLGVMNSLWFTFAAICAQGADIVPRSTAVTVLTGAWWGFVLLTLSAYTANMTAFMTQVNTGGIETLDALANQQEYEYGIMGDSAMLNLFLPDAKDNPYMSLYNYFKKDWNKTVIKSQEAALNRVLQGDFYLLASFETTVDALAQSCDFDISGNGFYKYQFALPFPRGSVYIQLFDDHIRRLRDSGVLARLEEKWFTLELKCETETATKNLENQLDLKAFTGMYVFLIIGVSSGLLICLLETGWIKCGGVSGLFGRAAIYEFDVDRKEIMRANTLLEKEFEGWEGGWDVWKFKEWNENSSLEKEFNKEAPSAIIRQNTEGQCLKCGRNMEKTQNIKMMTGAVETKPDPILQSPLVKEKSISKLMSVAEESEDSGRESASSGQFTANSEISEQVTTPPPPDFTDEKQDEQESKPDEKKMISSRSEILNSVHPMDFKSLPFIQKKDIKVKEKDMNTLRRNRSSSRTNRTNSKKIRRQRSRKNSVRQPPNKTTVAVDVHRIPPIESPSPVNFHLLPMESPIPLHQQYLESSPSFHSQSSLASTTLSFLSDSRSSLSSNKMRKTGSRSHSTAMQSARFAESTVSSNFDETTSPISSYYSSIPENIQPRYTHSPSEWTLSSHATNNRRNKYETDNDITVAGRRHRR